MVMGWTLDLKRAKKGERESGEQLHGAGLGPLLAGDDTASLLARL